MLEIIKKPVTLQPKTPKENEELCSHCNGIGWLQGEGYIEQCRDCYGRGVINLCPDCHKPIRGMCMESECSSKREQIAEENRFNKATKYTLDTVPKEHSEMFFSEVYGYNNGYFEDIDDLIDYCYCDNIEPPKYVWGTDKSMIRLDAYDIVSSACEELHEDAYSNISDVDIEEMQDFLDEWCKGQTGTTTYDVNYKYCILIEEGVENERTGGN